MPNFEHLVDPVLDIAQKAGEAILKIYHGEDFQVQYKTDDSPLTLADQTSNKIINTHISDLTPDIPIISEENDEIPYDIRKNYEYFWLIDPLDGTKEFVSRNGEFAVNIALVHHFRPILGIVWVPVTGEGYFAVKGKGSFSFKNGEKKQIHCSSFNMNDKGLRIPISRSYLNQATKDLIAQYDTPQLQPLGSALKFIKIAEGGADIYPRIGKTMEWDTAATQIILEEAGGKILDFHSRTPLVYNKLSLFNPDFIAHGIIL